jgi:hypothetical protein
MAVTVAGILLGNLKIHICRELVEFKEELNEIDLLTHPFRHLSTLITEVMSSGSLLSHFIFSPVIG